MKKLLLLILIIPLVSFGQVVLKTGSGELVNGYSIKYPDGFKIDNGSRFPNTYFKDQKRIRVIAEKKTANTKFENIIKIIKDGKLASGGSIISFKEVKKKNTLLVTGVYLTKEYSVIAASAFIINEYIFIIIIEIEPKEIQKENSELYKKIIAELKILLNEMVDNFI